jgi:hypothetical protein
MIAKTIFAAAVVGLLLARPCSAQTAAELLQKGIYTQDTVGDLDGAIRLYRQVLTGPSPQREYAAQAQGRIVQCLLKKGDKAAAGREFDKLAHDYPEFKDLLTSLGAESRGLAPGRGRVQLKTGPTRILSAIRGTVTDDTGRPLRGAQIRVSAPEPGSQPRTAASDEGGHYELSDLPAARYNVLVSRSGYLPLRYGQRRPLEQGKPLQILDGEALEHVDFMLPRMSLISGRIADETGEPIAAAMVLALRSIYFDGRRQLVPVSAGPRTRTDDDGEYRLVGLVPGTYVVMAMSDEKWTVDEDRGQVMSYAPTYFPGSASIRAARTITVGVGKEADRIDFSLVPRRTATISGTAVDSRGRPFKYVNLAFEVRGLDFGMFGSAATTAVADDGRFTISNIAPGHYKLEASTLQPGGGVDRAPEIAILPIDVDGVDIDNVALKGSGGGTVSGRIVAESGALPNGQGILIRLARRLLGQEEPLALGTFGNRVGIAQVNDDGTFSIAHVFGPARFDLSAPAGWAVKAVLQGGRDICDSVIDLKNGEQLADVQIVLTRRVSALAGRIVDDNGTPTADGTVVVFAADGSKWFEDSRFIQAVRPDQKGRFEVTGLPPGVYLVTAVDYVEQRSWFDPEYLDSLRPHAQPVTLLEGEAQTKSLKLSRP